MDRTRLRLLPPHQHDVGHRLAARKQQPVIGRDIEMEDAVFGESRQLTPRAAVARPFPEIVCAIPAEYADDGTARRRPAENAGRVVGQHARWPAIGGEDRECFDTVDVSVIGDPFAVRRDVG